MKKIQINNSILTFSVAFILTVLSSVYLYKEFYGHLYFWFESSYWECTWSYFMASLKDVALSKYISEFLLLGGKWRILSVVVFMLPLVALFLVSYRLQKKIKLHPVWSIFSILPSVLLFVLQTHRLFFLFYSIYILIYYAVFFLYLYGKSQTLRSTLALISYPLLYLFLPSGVLMILYLSMCLAEVFYFKKNEKESWKWYAFVLFSSLSMILGFFYSMIWNVFVMDEMAINNFLDLGFLFDVKEQSLMMLLLFVLPVLMLLLLSKIKVESKRMEIFFLLVQGSVLCVLLVAIWPFEKYASFENYFRIEKATFEEDWDEVIKLSENQKKEITKLFPYVVLAHAAKGELPEKMFEYPLKLENVFLPVYDKKNITMQSNITFHSLCGLYNMAIRCAEENASIRLNYDDFFVLKTLAMLNAKKGNVEVTQKFVNKLRLTLVHDDYIKEVEKTLNNFMSENVEKGELYYMTDNKLAELYNYSKKYELTVEARDMLLCGILQKRDYKAFASLFFEVFPYKTEKIPTIYEEFLISAQPSGIELPVADFVVSEATQKRFDHFMQIYTSPNDQSLKRRLMQKHHRNTWWYYSVYGE